MHREARVATRGHDGYGRTLARVVVDGVDLGDAQLGDGLAWVYRRYANDASMIALEASIPVLAAPIPMSVTTLVICPATIGGSIS